MVVSQEFGQRLYESAAQQAQDVPGGGGPEVSDDEVVDAEIVAELDGDLNNVVPGSIVSVLYDGEDKPERMLVGSIEEQREDVAVVSPASPLGEALLGASVGDRLTFEAPGGDLMVQVMAIGR